MNRNKGMVLLVGAGPGDPGLFTRRGAEAVGSAEVILYDRLVNPGLLDGAPDGCEKIFVGKGVGNHGLSQKEINELIIRKAREGKRVVRLKGGDPFVFGRGGEEALALEEENIPYSVVPGVTSAVAALAAAGIPITHRGLARSFHVITGHTMESDTAHAGESAEQGRFVPYGSLEGTLVFLMAVAELPVIAGELMEGGKSGKTPACLVEQGTTIRQRRIDGTLETIAGMAQEQGIRPPAILVVGEAAAFHLTSRALPLSGRRIGVTGTFAMVRKLSADLEGLGAQVFEACYLKIVPTSVLARRNPDFEQFSWLVFTSANGVEQFFEQIRDMDIDIRRLSRCRFAVIGPGTGQALWNHGIRADYMPCRYTVEELAQGVAGLALPGERLLALRAGEGSVNLARIWQREGLGFEDLGIYETRADEEAVRTLWQQADVLDTVTFASASGVRAFFESARSRSGDPGPGAEGENPGKRRFPQRLVCIGNKTEEALRERLPGEEWGRIRTAKEYTAKGLVEACLDG